MKRSSRKSAERDSGKDLTEIDIRVGHLSLGKALGLSLLLLLITLLVLFGVLIVARGAPVHGVVVEGLRSIPPAVDDPLFARAIELHTGAQLTSGNTVEILLDGD